MTIYESGMWSLPQPTNTFDHFYMNRGVIGSDIRTIVI